MVRTNWTEAKFAIRKPTPVAIPFSQKKLKRMLPEEGNAKLKRKGTYLRVFVAVALIAFLIKKVDFHKALSFFVTLNSTSIALISLVAFALIFMSTYKWKMFLSHLYLPIPLWRLFNFYIIGYFFNNFLPTNVGGDAVRFLFTAQGKRTYSDSFVAVFMERFTGLVALLLFVTISFPLALYHFNFIQNVKYVLPPLAVLAGGIMLVLYVNPAFLGKCGLSNTLIARVHQKVSKILKTIQSFRNQKRLLICTLLISLLFNLLAIFNVYIVAWALNVPLSLYGAFVFVPIILLISTMPFSINGLGIVEGAYVLCLTHTGIGAPAALSIALLMRAKNILLSAVGGLLFLFYRRYYPSLGAGFSRREADIA